MSASFDRTNFVPLLSFSKQIRYLEEGVLRAILPFYKYIEIVLRKITEIQ